MDLKLHLLSPCLGFKIDLRIGFQSQTGAAILTSAGLYPGESSRDSGADHEGGEDDDPAVASVRGVGEEGVGGAGGSGGGEEGLSTTTSHPLPHLPTSARHLRAVTASGVRMFGIRENLESLRHSFSVSFSQVVSNSQATLVTHRTIMGCRLESEICDAKDEGGTWDDADFAKFALLVAECVLNEKAYNRY